MKREPFQKKQIIFKEIDDFCNKFARVVRIITNVLFKKLASDPKPTKEDLKEIIGTWSRCIDSTNELLKSGLRSLKNAKGKVGEKMIC